MRDWNCPWPLDWQRHYRVLSDLVDADGVLPEIQPGVLFEGDDIGRWLQRQKNPGTWAQLSTEQQQRLSKLGIKPLENRPPTPAAARKGKAQEAFQRGLTALAQWVEKEGQRAVPRGAVVEIEVDGETEAVQVKLGIWISNTKTRRDKLTQEQLDALAELGMAWARPVAIPQAAPTPSDRSLRRARQTTASPYPPVVSQGLAAFRQGSLLRQLR